MFGSEGPAGFGAGVLILARPIAPVPAIAIPLVQDFIKRTVESKFVQQLALSIAVFVESCGSLGVFAAVALKLAEQRLKKTAF